MHFRKTYDNGRGSSSYSLPSLGCHFLMGISPCYHKACLPGIILFLLPAMTIGCSSGVLSFDSDAVRVSAFKSPYTSSFSESTLDILTFEDDRLRRLDSYWRIEGFNGNTIWPASTGGEKIFFMCMNSQRDRYEWADIRSYSSLGNICCNLEEEDRDSPAMTGECRSAAGCPASDICLTPLVSEVYIGSLKCDFSGTPYSGKKITDVRIYLTNVNASCPLLDDGSGKGIRLINAGMLNEDDVRKFSHRDMIVQELAKELGTKAVKASKGLLCYPYRGDPSRSTRLVVEGKIDGQTYFWPTEVCSEGISRNHRYIFRINIRRKGTSDPDNLIERPEIEFETTIKPWMEKEEYTVGF